MIHEVVLTSIDDGGVRTSQAFKVDWVKFYEVLDSLQYSPAKPAPTLVLGGDISASNSGMIPLGFKYLDSGAITLDKVQAWFELDKMQAIQNYGVKENFKFNFTDNFNKAQLTSMIEDGLTSIQMKWATSLYSASDLEDPKSSLQPPDPVATERLEEIRRARECAMIEFDSLEMRGE